MNNPRSAPVVIEPVAVPLTQAPATFGLSRSALYRAAEAGHIKLLKLGRSTLVDAASVRAYLSSLPPVRFGVNPAGIVTKAA